MLNVVNSNKVSPIFKFYTTACFGWVFVPWNTLRELSIDPTQFSTASNADDQGVYLDEDFDFPLFEGFFRKTTGERVILHDVHDEDADVSIKPSIRVYLKKEGNK